MAISKCAVCGTELNDAAASCPKCQEHTKTGSARKYFWVAGGCALAVLVVAGLLSLHKSAVPGPSAPLSAQEISTITAQAEAGAAVAQRRLGAAYSKGDGVKQDYKEAAKWYERAATQGDPEAQDALGDLYDAGQGVPHDQTKAAEWYRKGAEQGLAGAQYNLAAMYAVGKGVPLDNAQALKWYLQAANQGDSLAQYNVGMRYFEGHGIARDSVQAFKWLSLASDQGVPDATRPLKQVKAMLSSSQLDQARELLRQFTLQKSGAAGK